MKCEKEGCDYSVLVRGSQCAVCVAERGRDYPDPWFMPSSVWETLDPEQGHWRRKHHQDDRSQWIGA